MKKITLFQENTFVELFELPDGNPCAENIINRDGTIQSANGHQVAKADDRKKRR